MTIMDVFLLLGKTMIISIERDKGGSYLPYLTVFMNEPFYVEKDLTNE